MKNRYFSIGELSKIKSVSIKNLRYYDHIGVLKPAYTNPDNGYRYYTFEQFYTVDLIKFCIALDIPLKHYQAYVTGNKIDLNNFLEECHKQAKDYLQKAKRNLFYVEKALGDLDTLNHQNINTLFMKEVPERLLYIEAFNGSYGSREFIEALSHFKRTLFSSNKIDSFDYGLLKIFKKNHVLSYLYCAPHQEIDNDIEQLLLPNSTVQCIINPFDMIHSVEHYFNFDNTQERIIIEKELCSAYITTSNMMLEMQCYSVLSTT